MEFINIVFKVKKIMHRDNDTRFSIIRGSLIKHDSENGLTKDVTIKGYFPSIYVGDVFSSLSAKELDKTYGHYLELIEYPKTVLPENQKALAEFISRRVKGLSVKKALEIVDSLGINALSKIKDDYKILLTVDGIKERKAEKIYEQLISHEAYEELVLFIQGIGIRSKIANKIYEKYQDVSLSRIKNNPYCICHDNEISFEYAEKIAMNLNLSKHNPNRIETAIMDYIEYRIKSFGDICIYREMILNSLNEFLDKYNVYTDNDLEEIEILYAIEKLSSKHLIKMETNNKGQICVYKSLYHTIENNIVQNLKNILGYSRLPFATDTQIANFITQYEKENFELDIMQRQAIYTAIQNGISILTGGPGTGKTNTMNAIVKCILSINEKSTITLLAPTGKASERMSELTNMVSSTIHRGIKLAPFNENKELDYVESDFVFIDESSMIDAFVFEKLTSVISPNTRVIFIGDFNQLPSVGAGLLLRDMIESGAIPTTQLTKIFRQAESSKIVYNANRIIQGKDTHDVDGVDIKNEDGSNFIFWKDNNPMSIRNKILLSLDRLSSHYHYKLKDICILAPMKMGDIGVDELNRLLQKKLNPASPLKSEYEVDALHCLRVGDRVIQNTNNSDLNVFNGFVGIITDIYTEITASGNDEYRIEVEYPQREDVVIYQEMDIEQLELAYAMTIHKSQGSEFPVVLMPIHETQKKMLNCNLVYTGVTRAKEMLIMIGQEDALNYSIHQTEAFQRISRIKEKLEAVHEEYLTLKAVA